MMVPVQRGMHFISLKGDKVLCISLCDGVPYFFPVVIQFLEASAVKVHHKSGFFISLRYIRPHGMSGDSAEIKMAFRTV